MRKMIKVSFVFLIVGVFFIFFQSKHEVIKYSNEKSSYGGYKTLSELQSAAKSGIVEAQTDLGIAYERGVIVQKNYKEAAYWYSQASMKGYAQAQYDLGVAYENGRGLHMDFQKAMMWYEKAARQGLPNAQVNLAMLYIYGQGTSINYEKAEYWLKQAAGKNDTVAMNNIANMYSRGIGVPQNYTEAVRWYRKAVHLGSMRAKNSLALLYEHGLGTLPKDKKIALSLIKSSACQGYAVAQNNLGRLYSDKDDVIAYAWFSVASSNGLADAKDSMNRIAGILNEEQRLQAENIANKYIEKYPSPREANDTYKSGSECKYQE
ncbi:MULTISPECIES: tetratricopeptide repeat protein [Enterobacterales]|uniref:tetratricopeptide repeat protein n=1 Tax=Enterobacterales TaxID=91347 RepID=UPI002ED9B4BD